MPSIWYQCRCAPHEPLRMRRGLSLETALDLLPEAVASWVKDETGRSARPLKGSLFEYALFQGGRFHGSAWIETCSPPSGAEQWDRRRVKARKP
jgi:hypothetical protein